MAAYRLTSPTGVILTSGPTLITPTDTDAWATYQAWLDAGNVPDPETVLPTQGLEGDPGEYTADGVDEWTLTSIINPSTVTIFLPMNQGVDYAIEETVTDGELIFTTTVPGYYVAKIRTAGYQDWTLRANFT